MILLHDRQKAATVSNDLEPIPFPSYAEAEAYAIERGITTEWIQRVTFGDSRRVWHLCYPIGDRLYTVSQPKRTR